MCVCVCVCVCVYVCIYLSVCVSEFKPVYFLFVRLIYLKFLITAYRF